MQQGFTLLEVIVTITILTILTALLTRAFPEARRHQALVEAEQQLRSQLRRAQTLALNEHRDPDCLNQAGDDPGRQRTCSDIGVHLDGNLLTMFADTADDDLYTPDDYQLGATALSPPVTAAAQTILFEATPPNTSLLFNGSVVAAGNSAQFILTASDVQFTYLVYPYGQIERQ